MSEFPRAVLFDFDGVIVNSEPVHLRAFQLAAREKGIDIHKEHSMKKLVFAVLLVGLFSLAMTGCKAEGEIKDHSAIAAPR